MQLTQRAINRYAGGQLEVQNANEGYLYRGEIASLEISGPDHDRQLTVHLKWFAELDKESGEWQAADSKPYETSLLMCSISEISEGRLRLSSWITGETTVLYLPDGSKLDPAKVRGLAAGS